MGEGLVQVCVIKMAQTTVQEGPWPIRSLEIGTTLTILTATKNMKSRVKGDFHARFCGKVGVKLPCLTRLNKPPS